MRYKTSRPATKCHPHPHRHRRISIFRSIPSASTGAATMAQTYPRKHAVAARLQKLPAELVHQIYDDSRLGDVLVMLAGNRSATDVSHAAACVLSHPSWGRAVTPSLLPVLLDLLSLYLTIHTRQRRQSAQHTPLEAPWAHRAWHRGTHAGVSDEVSQLVRDAGQHIRELLLRPHRGLDYLPVLREHAPIPVLTGGGGAWADHRAREPVSAAALAAQVAEFREAWEATARAKELLCARKARQCRRLTALLVEFPGMLRDGGYHSQEHRSMSAQRHRRESLERVAAEMDAGSRLHAAVFARHRLPLVPYDRFLRGFLRALRKLPPQDAVDAGCASPYPPQVRQDIATALEGLGFVYTRVSEFHYVYEAIPRTRFTENPAGMNQPRFEDGGPPPGYYDCLMPFAEEEFLWLEAFLRCCRFMQGMKELPWFPVRFVDVGGKAGLEVQE